MDVRPDSFDGAKRDVPGLRRDGGASDRPDSLSDRPTERRDVLGDALSDARDASPDSRDVALVGTCVSSGALMPAGTVCRAAAGPCDEAETCSGKDVDCPIDRLKPAATVCRASIDGNTCDPPENCTGLSANCPADVLYALPAVPTGVVATSGTQQASIAWAAAARATGYNVKRSSTSGSGYTTLGTSPAARTSPYTDQGLTGGATYFYVVSAINTLSTCESANSMQVTANPAKPCTPPAAPTITAVPGDGTITLHWVPVAGATSYLVARREGSVSSYSVIGMVLAGGTFTDAHVVNGTQYSYFVTADNGMCTSVGSAPVSVTPACAGLPAPTGVVAAPANGEVTLTWIASSGAVLYQISRNTTGTGTFTPIGTTAAASFLDKQVASGTKYYYVVTVSNGACWSADSAVVSATPLTPNYVIFDDAFRNGWVNWSWDAIFAFVALAPPQLGAASVSLSFLGPWSGFQLHNDTAVSCAGKTAFTFWAHGGATGTRRVRFSIKNAAGVPSEGVLLSVPSGAWTKMTVNLSDLGNPENVKEVIIQNVAGFPQPAFNIAQLELD